MSGIFLFIWVSIRLLPRWPERPARDLLYIIDVGNEGGFPRGNLYFSTPFLPKLFP